MDSTAKLISWIQFGATIFVLFFFALGFGLFLHKTISPINKSLTSIKKKIYKETAKKREKK